MKNLKNRNIQEDGLRKHDKFLLFCVFLIMFNTGLNLRIVWWVVLGILAFLLMAKLTIGKVNIDKYMIWSFTFYIVISLSSLWAIDRNYSFDSMISILGTCIILWYISITVKNKYHIYEILKLFLFATAITGVYMLFLLDFSAIGDVRIGDGSLSENWNSNYIGMLMALSTVTTITLIKTKEIQIYKILYILLSILYVFIAIFSGSRKALFIIIFASSLYLFLSSKKHKYTTLVMVILGALVFFNLIMNIPSLYNVLGSRIEGLFIQFTGQGTVDYSTLHRINMIEAGWQWFQNKPIFGYGIDNFKVLYGSLTGSVWYSHNNYIELLVGVGVIGTIIYYFGYFYIIKNSLRVFKRPQPLLNLAFTSIITILIIEVGLVSYDTLYIQLFVCLSFCAIKVDKVVDQ
jgi:O-antigen ligase